MRDLDAAAGAAPDLLLVAAQHLEGAAADGADAEQADLDGLHVVTTVCVLSMRVALAVVVEEARDAADGVGEVVGVGQEDDAEVVRLRPS